MLGPHEMLPLHLQLMLMRSLASPGAWQSWSGNWPGFVAGNPLEQWAATLRVQAAATQRAQARAKRSRVREKRLHDILGKKPETAEGFDAAVGAEALRRAQAFLAGVAAVGNQTYIREETPRPVLWRRGAARLLDYAPKARGGAAMLVIPSLINRAEILDLTPQHSFLGFLAGQGIRPLLLDWGEPGEEERGYGCADYINAIALGALTHAREAHDGPLTLLGYCMGGVFAVAMAQLAPMSVDALLLLATPWEFDTPDSPRIALPEQGAAMLRQFFAALDPVPPAVINGFFHLLDPWAVQRRYARFLKMDETERSHFLAVEHWLSRGVPLASRVAQESFVDWPQDNILAAGKWKVGRKWIAPEAVRCPALAIIPAHDKIVPASCALPLAERLSRCDMLRPSLGHVSMVASEEARNAVWKPLAQWVQERF